MIVVLKKNIPESEKVKVREFLQNKGFQVREIVGEEDTIFGAVGVVRIDPRTVEILPGVDRVIPITKPFKLASRELKKENTVVRIGPVKIGGDRVVVIAGPCAVESREVVFETARIIREAGGVMLRGGAFKPRTSPYAFQGLGEEGLKILKEAGEKYGLPVATEIVATAHADMMKEYVDLFQIGARNMQNYELLKVVGQLGKPVLLKRGLAATIEEWLMAAEYLLAHGTDQVVLCERGIRTFETYTRNTLDLSAIPVVKKLSHLPVLVDPSHGTGLRGKVSPMGLAAIAAGADGLLVEVHPAPEKALSDGPQSLYPGQFEKLMRDIQALCPVVGKELERIPVTQDFRSGTERNGALQVSVKTENAEVAFQGVRGAYSEMAMHRYFGDGVNPVECPRFRDVFESVLNGDASFGMVPIENSLAGSIYESVDLLLQYPDVLIVGEQQIRIVHNLIGLPEAETGDVRKVYSHPQGLAQCANFFDTHKTIEQIPFFDTAGAVAYIADLKDPGCAAIAGEEAARVYRMKILKEGIETNPRNYTKFYIIAREGTEPLDLPNRMAVMFTTADTPGALFASLKILADYGLNMKKLESRPIEGKPWQYMFFLELEIPSDTAIFSKGMKEFHEKAGDVRVLGKFRSSGI